LLAIFPEQMRIRLMQQDRQIFQLTAVTPANTGDE